MKSRLRIRSLSRRGIMTTTEASWAWFRVGLVDYQLASDEERLSLAAGLSRPLMALVGRECHLLVVPRECSRDEWIDSMQAVDGSRPIPEWGPYVEMLADRVDSLHFRRREVYLGVKLDNPVAPAVQSAKTFVERVFGLRSEEPVVDSEKLTLDAEQLGRVLKNAGLDARHASPVELSWLIHRMFWRGIAGSDSGFFDNGRSSGGETVESRRSADTAVVDEQEIAALAEGTLHNHRHFLRVEQPGAESYFASLAFARFTTGLQFPGNEWLWLYELLDFPVEASVRFQVVSAHQAARDVGKKLAEARGQASHIQGAGASPPMALLETLKDGANLEHDLLKADMPMLYCWPRLMVWGATQQELDQRVRELKTRYANIGALLACPTGDQLSLFLEAMPGEKVHRKIYEQRIAPVTLAGSMFAATSELGSETGPYFGETINAKRLPVLFDPLAAPRSRKEGTLVTFTGRTGRGKTTAALLMLVQVVMRGAIALLVDPKGDSGNIGHLLGHKRVRYLQLSEAHAGAFDPYALAQEDAATLALDLLRMLLPSAESRRHEAALLAECKAEEQAERPCLLGVVRRLRESPNADITALGKTLGMMAEMRFARLCFGDGTTQALEIGEPGTLTVLQFAHIPLPTEGTSPDDYTTSERFGAGLIFAVTAFCHRLMDVTDRQQPKVVVFDEAWMVTSSPRGRALIHRLAVLGREYNTVIGLISQSAADLVQGSVRDSIATSFAFGARSREQAVLQLQLAGLSESEDLVQTFLGLGNGECVMTDLQGRIGTMYVDLVLADMAVALRATPATNGNGVGHHTSLDMMIDLTPDEPAVT